ADDERHRDREAASSQHGVGARPRAPHGQFGGERVAIADVGEGRQDGEEPDEGDGGADIGRDRARAEADEGEDEADGGAGAGGDERLGGERGESGALFGGERDERADDEGAGGGRDDRADAHARGAGGGAAAADDA